MHSAGRISLVRAVVVERLPEVQRAEGRFVQSPVCAEAGVFLITFQRCGELGARIPVDRTTVVA